ncbi:MAG: energy-coupling factor ABC transporter permease [Candidatus Odinarchaeota archaeon]
MRKHIHTLVGRVIMHIPDGWLSFEVSVIAWFFTLVFIIISLNKLRDMDENPEKLVSMATVAAIIFLAQMLNFPLFIGPVTGHLLGAALATLILGPWAAILVIASVLFIQALFFADGGLVFALGANIFNMAVIGSITSEGIRRFIQSIRKGKDALFITGFVAAFSAVIVASALAAVELIFSGHFPDPLLGLVTVLFWHLFIGIGEGLITVGIFAFLWRIDFHTDHLRSESSSLVWNKKTVTGLAFLLGTFTILAIIPALFEFPTDGLDYVGSELFNFNQVISGINDAFRLGISDDYNFLGLGPVFGTVLAAILGVAIIIALFWLLKHFHSHRVGEVRQSKDSDTKSKFIITVITVAVLSLIVTFDALVVSSSFALIIIVFYFKPVYHKVLVKMLIPLPLILSLTLISFISRPEVFVFSNGLFNATFTNYSFSLFQTIRSFVIVFLALSFIEGEDSFYEVIYALDELPFPKMLNNLIFLMYRFIFTTREELNRILEARYNRHYEAPGRFSWTHLKITGYIIAGLIARSLKKSDAIADNLNTRGFHRSFPHEPKKWTGIGVFLLIFTLSFNSWILLILG